MNRLQETLLRVGREIGLQVIAPFELSLSGGRRLLADALLPELGFSRGMIIVRSFDDIWDVRDELMKLGYGYSVLLSYKDDVLSEPSPNEDIDVEGWMDTFWDWGWSAKDKPEPEWIKFNLLQKRLLRAGRELGLQVTAPFEVTLAGGRKLWADALLPELGGRRGMVVVRSFDEDDDADELLKLGYASCPIGMQMPYEKFDVRDWMEVFKEWGWSAEDEKRPDWMKGS